ncbi:MAG: stage II sporulation protein R [Clostridium sp.]|nr:stage II sporulation protein R [Clostridium sp.]MCM1460753.1 stage II sporulation protein R [Bacteroides sp.]
MKSNMGRIMRGACIGIFLGVVGGLALSYGMHFKNIVDGTMADKYTDDVVNVFAKEEQSDTNADILLTANENPPECSSLEDVILRFHVKANSNSDEDIALKYAVRDAVLMEIGGELEGNKTREEVMDYLSANLWHIQDIAAGTVAEKGFAYPINVYISNDYFPMRQYGDMVFPAGEYQALRIDIGQAQGENFWCVLYPMTCYTYESAAVITNEDAEEIARCISPEEYEKLFVNREVKRDKVKVRFKILDWIL